VNEVGRLKKRMAELALALEGDPAGLALLGLGSVGVEEARLDEWSDLDFFAIVRPGEKGRFLDDPRWLSVPAPVSYLFRNTRDGFKLLWEDGIFGEMAVFEPGELQSIPFSEGKVWWAREGFDESILKPTNPGGRLKPVAGPEFAAGELLTCLHAGLCRWRRGETLSAWRFIQGYALDRAIELAEVWEPEGTGLRDPYNRDRRFETRYPSMKPLLARVLRGYERVPESALALLEWLESKTPVNGAIAREIRKLAEG